MHCGKRSTHISKRQSHFFWLFLLVQYLAGPLSFIIPDNNGPFCSGDNSFQLSEVIASCNPWVILRENDRTGGYNVSPSVMWRCVPQSRRRKCSHFPLSLHHQLVWEPLPKVEVHSGWEAPGFPLLNFVRPLLYMGPGHQLSKFSGSAAQGTS
jgi:hypothetical protein